MNFILVIEGGGTGPALKAEMAEGFRRFLNRIDPSLPKPRIIRGGGRSQALAKFSIAWRSRKAGDIVLLLIDSEEALRFGGSKITHLVARDGWKDKPPDITESDVFLMVCAMETWISSDRDALRTFYNGGFNESKLLPLHQLESAPPGALLESLTKATKECKTKKPYSKGSTSFELIGLIDPVQLVILPHAKQFIDEFRSKLKR